jgi:type II secretory pathway pseudopilin PulG
VPVVETVVSLLVIVGILATVVVTSLIATRDQRRKDVSV